MIHKQNSAGGISLAYYDLVAFDYRYLASNQSCEQSNHRINKKFKPLQTGSVSLQEVIHNLQPNSETLKKVEALRYGSATKIFVQQNVLIAWRNRD